MRLAFTIITLLACFTLHAKFRKATILFNDGRTQNGYIKSFLEGRILSGGFTNNLEHELNLDDKTVKFKTTEEAEVQELSIDDINEVTLFYESGFSQIFKVLLLKEIDKKGGFKESVRKVFLPLLKKGRVNIYAVRYILNSGNGTGSGFVSGSRFYYQNAKENYAINYSNVGFSFLFNVSAQTLNPLRDLFKDCPSILAKIDDTEKKMSDKNTTTKEERKAQKEKHKTLMKEYHALDKEKRKELTVIHHYELNFQDTLIKKYESCQ